MSDYLRKYEGLFTLTPQRMRMIVDAFEEALEKGLSEWDQCVVSTKSLLQRLHCCHSSLHPNFRGLCTLANPTFR